VAPLFKADAPNSVLEVKKYFPENAPLFSNADNLTDLWGFVRAGRCHTAFYARKTALWRADWFDERRPREAICAIFAVGGEQDRRRIKCRVCASTRLPPCSLCFRRCGELTIPRIGC